jgi:hypothetical protein
MCETEGQLEILEPQVSVPLACETCSLETETKQFHKLSVHRQVYSGSVCERTMVTVQLLGSVSFEDRDGTEMGVTGSVLVLAASISPDLACGSETG